jgi:gliding motility-associated-like protein
LPAVFAADQILCAGATAAALTSTAPATGGTGSYAYQWESSANNTTWTAISGATAATYAPGPLTQTTYFRRQVTSGTGAGSTAVTAAVTITISPALTAGSVAADQVLCAGATPAALTSTAPATGGTGTYAYQWESSTDNATWTAISGATAATHAPGPLTQTTYFRRQVTSGSGTCARAFTTSVTLSVSPGLTAGAIGTNQNLCAEATPAPLTSTADATGGTGTYAYQWESSVDNTTWTVIAGATSAGYTPASLSATTYFRRQVSSGTGACATATSNVVTLQLSPALLAGRIAADQALCTGDTPAALTSTAPATGGTGTYAYQWESSPDNATWTAISGATAATYAPGPLNQTTYFRRQDSSGGCGTAYTNVVKLTPTPAVVPGAVAESQSVCAGTAPASLTSLSTGSGGTGTYTYQWESSVDNTTWTAIAGATSAGFTPGPLTVTTDFRRRVSSGVGTCATAYTGKVTITVLPAVTAGTVGANQTLCTSTVPAPLTNTGGAGGGVGSYAYQWESSADNATWTAISGATAATYAPSSLTQTTHFRRRVTSGTGACATAVSNVVTLTVTPAQPAGVALTTPAPQCAGSALTLTPAPSNAGPAPTFRWFVNGVLAATTPVFTSAALANNDQVRVEMTPTPGACSSGVPTATVIVTITPTEVATVAIRALGPGGVACAGTVLSFDIDKVTGAGSAPQYQWLLNGSAVPGGTGATFSSAALRDNDRLRLQMTSSASCTSPAVVTSNELVIKIRTEVLPTFSIVGTGAGCAGSAVKFSMANSSGLGTAPTYQWRVDGTDVPGAQSATFSSTTLRDGQLVTLAIRTFSTACGQPVAVVSNAVRAVIIPTVDVEAGPDKEIAEGESVELEGTANGTYPVEWSPAQGLSFLGGNRLRPVASPTETTVYTLRANVNGCQDESRVTVKVGPPLGIPDAFSPNGDGINDTWEIDRIGKFPGNTVRVYNRWGSQIFSTTDYGRTNEWNGTSQGRAMPVGTYYYVITLNNGKSYSGPLTVVY